VLQPVGLVDILAGVMLATATYCVARLVAARLWGRTLNQDVNIAHTADAVAMAGMLVAGLRTLPDTAWEVVFATMTVWFAARGARLVLRGGLGVLDGDHVHGLSHYMSHLVMSAAMLYMFLETSGAGHGSRSVMSAMGGTGSAPSNATLLALLFLLALFASAVWHADGLTRFTTTRPALLGVGAGAALGAGSRPAGSAPSTAPTGGGGGASAPSADMDTPTEAAQAEQSRRLAPRLEMACHIVVCITMGYMLVLML
jgi:hypothetical protein